MSETPPTIGSASNPLDHTDWSGTETKDLDVARRNVQDLSATLYRYLNGLDVDVDITVEATDSQDTSFSDTEELRGSASGSEATLTVTNGSVDSDFITEPWELLRISVTPASNPSSGQFELRSLDQGDVRA